ncbi:hypothetical protein [Belliella alkalica]|nr:hypothetical protein [Belliella alkalica]
MIMTSYGRDISESKVDNEGKKNKEKSVNSFHSSSADVLLSKVIDESSNDFSDFGSEWVWPDYTMDLVESFTPFLFRTKESAQFEEIRVVLNVDNRGKLVGYEFITEVDKGLEERMAHVLRKLPKCLPVPGYSSYEATDFELIIRR